MARDDDEEPLAPATRTWLDQRPLEPLSMAELDSYVLALKAEIARIEAAKAAKETHRAGIEALFGKAS